MDKDWQSDPELLESGELGRYDFDRYVYYLAARDDRAAVDITAEHEYFHHLLADGTNYGRLTLEARRNLRASGDERDRRVFRALVREAVVVNEMVATYASVARLRPSTAAELPSGYKSVYERCARLVEHSFESPQLGIAYSLALGSCLLMVRPSEVELDALRAGRLDRLPPSASPDKCLDVAERHLLSQPRDAVRIALRDTVAFYSSLGALASDPAAVRAAETEAALLERIDENAELEPLLHRVLAELLEAVLPGFDDAAAEFRMDRNWRLWKDDQRVGDAGAGVLERARAMAQQRVALWPRSPRPVTFRGRPVDELAAVGASGVDSSWTYGVYCYAQRPKKATEVVLISVRWRGGPPTATYVVLGDAETAALLHWPGPLVTIADHAIFSSFDDIESDRRLRGLLDRECFVHVSENPIDFLLQCLDERRSVKWFYGAVGYQTEAIEAEHGLHIVLYEVEGTGVNFFHFSNTMMTAGLELFTERAVADPGKVAMVSVEEAQELARTSLISPLLDHPLVLSHVRVGDALPADVRELATSSEPSTT